MIKQHFTIPFRLPSLNDYVLACRSNPHAGAMFKRDTDASIGWAIKPAHLKPVANPCIVHMVFHEPNQRRDVDNVESAKKFILDALTGCSILQGDSPKWVVGVPSYTVYGDPAKVDVVIVESDNTEALRVMLHTAMIEIGEV